jgi:hypothetical protein
MPKISRLVSQTWWKIPKEIRDRIEAAEKLKESQLNLSSSDIHEVLSSYWAVGQANYTIESSHEV